MRIFTFVVICIFISSTISAQHKGNILLGGSIGFFDYKSDANGTKNNQTSIYLNPSFGKFYSKNRMAGINLNYYHSKYRDSLSSNSYGLGIFLRQYQALGKSFFIFVEENLSASTTKYNDDIISGIPADVKAKQKAVGAYVFPGISYAANKRLQIEIGLPQLLSIYYAHQTLNYESVATPIKNKYNVFSANTGFKNGWIGDLTFGVRWMIGRN